jgi:hypothetical protein
MIMEPTSKVDEMDIRLCAALEAYAAGERGESVALVMHRVREEFGLGPSLPKGDESCQGE